MEKFIENHRPIKGDRDNWKLYIEEIEIAVLKLHTTKLLGQDSFTTEFYHLTKK